jgi:tetratricopeptide (TPR) repeat protein
MKATVALALLGACAATVPVRAAQPASSVYSGPSQPNQDSLLAAESFLNSAVEMTCCPSSTPARAGRLVVLSRLADRLAPGDWRVNRLLADICLAQADPNAEIKALESYLAGRPDDHQVRTRWMNARLAGMQNVAARDAFLRSLAQRKDLDEPVRAQALARLTDLLVGQGRTADAAETARQAVALDPYGPAPLAALRLTQTQEPNDPNSALTQDLLAIRARPRAFDAAWRVGMRLGELGLSEKALEFLSHVWAAGAADSQPVTAPTSMTAQYASGLLDANQPDKAVEVLQRALQRYADNPDLASLLIEAYRKAGKESQAGRLIQDMAKAYKAKEGSATTAPALAAELGWFYARTQPHASLAVVYAGRAVAADPDNPVFQRIMGAAELVGDQVKQGMARLEKLLGKDVYASILLAERYQAAGDKDNLRKAVLAAAPLGASGPAWRRLSDIAARNRIELPAPKGRDETLALLKGLPPDCLKMLSRPNECISIQLAPVVDADGRLLCGEPIEVDATLKNVCSTDVPLGATGVINPLMAMTARLEDSRGQVLVDTTRLPLAVWAAPRALKPGQTVTCRVRLDVCELAAAVAPHPLEDLSLIVGGIVDPDADGATRLPYFKLQPLKVIRSGLLGKVADDTPDGWRLAYQLALGRIVYDYRRGKLPVRMRAARQIGSMLAFNVDVERSRQEPPGMLQGQIDRLTVLSMFRAILADKSPAVRSEAARAIGAVQPDDTVIGLLSPLIEDPAAMVRCRLVEMLAATASRGNATIVDLMSKDPDPLVRQMAEAFKGR